MSHLPKIAVLVVWMMTACTRLPEEPGVQAPGPWQGTSQLGAVGATSQGNAIAVDSAYGLYVVGETGGDFDGNTAAGAVDMVIVKYSGAGEKLWTRQVGDASGNTYGHGVAVDSEGYLYVTGHTTADLYGNVNAGGDEYILIKYDGDGNRLLPGNWGREWERLSRPKGLGWIPPTISKSLAIRRARSPVRQLSGPTTCFSSSTMGTATANGSGYWERRESGPADVPLPSTDPTIST